MGMNKAECKLTLIFHECFTIISQRTGKNFTGRRKNEKLVYFEQNDIEKNLKVW